MNFKLLAGVIFIIISICFIFLFILPQIGFQNPSFESARSDNSLVPSGWFYGNDDFTNSDDETWDVNIYSLSSDSYSGSRSLFINLENPDQRVFLKSPLFNLEQKRYQITFYVKNNIEYVSGDQERGCLFEVLVRDIDGNPIIDYGILWSNSNIDVQDWATPESILDLDVNWEDVDGWKKITATFNDKIPPNSRMRFFIGEHTEVGQYNGHVLIDDIDLEVIE